MSKNKGFTLIELSIVVVIIGLIVAGQSLVRQAKVRSLIADIDKYVTANNTFLLKYNGRAGDLINANDY